jgi:hypothetical protein
MLSFDRHTSLASTLLRQWLVVSQKWLRIANMPCPVLDGDTNPSIVAIFP